MTCLNKTGHSTKISFLLLLVMMVMFQLLFLQAEEPVDEKPYLDISRQLLQKGLEENQAYAILQKITSVGPRLTGSSQAAAAVKIMYKEMLDMGLDNVHLEPVQVGQWTRGTKEEARITSAEFGNIPLTICAIGGSVSTPQGELSGQVIEIRSRKEFDTIGDMAEGKIIFFNQPMDPTNTDTFRAYGEAAWQRVLGASMAASVGSVAVLVRSVTTAIDDFPHTGLMFYDPKYKKIPAACLSTKSANMLSRSLKNDPGLLVHMRMDCEQKKPVLSYNVVGEITGSEIPDEIVLFGGHLDSWDKGTGAHDDGAGCAHSMEAIRLIKEAGLKPRRTIRAVLFMDEEFGGTGGKAYAKAEERSGETHLAAIESDRGGFLPVAFGIGGDEAVFSVLKKWEYLFRIFSPFEIRRGGGGVDIGPLAEGGTVLMSLIPDCQRYFDVHHCGRDIIDTVNPRELELGAVFLAIFSFVLAQEGLE